MIFSLNTLASLDRALLVNGRTSLKAPIARDLVPGKNPLICLGRFLVGWGGNYNHVLVLGSADLQIMLRGRLDFLDQICEITDFLAIDGFNRSVCDCLVTDINLVGQASKYTYTCSFPPTIPQLSLTVCRLFLNFDSWPS